MAASDLTTQRRACIALDAFCENLTDELGPYLEQLMTQMEHVLDADDPDLREVRREGGRDGGREWRVN